MFRKICAFLIVGFVFLTLAHTSPGQESLPVLDNMVRQAARAAELQAPLDPANWKTSGRQWQTERLTEALGLGLTIREPMKAAVTDRTQAGDLVIERIAYLWAEQTYVSATIIRNPKTPGRQPAMVIPSGWLGHYTFRAYRGFVDALARQGMVVLFIDDPRTLQRQAPYAGLYATAELAGMPVTGIQVMDALRGLDYLRTRDDVDPGNIGIAGLGEGARQAILAAAVEPMFQFVVAVEGTTTYSALARAAAEGEGPQDPSAFVSGILAATNLDRAAACLAPRPVLIAGQAGQGKWAADGYEEVLRTMTAVYRIDDATDQISQLPPKSPPNDVTPYIPDIERWLQTTVLPKLKSSASAPLPCGPPEEPDFSMLRFMQRQVAQRAAGLPAQWDSKTDWDSYRGRIVDLLGASFRLGNFLPAKADVVDAAEAGGLVTERLVMCSDTGYRCPLVLVRPAEPGPTPCAGMVLSHDDRQCAASAKIAESARQLALAGYWVVVPDHASVHPQSLQPLADAESPSFYGDEAARYYGPADAVGSGPLLARVQENLAAFQFLAGVAETDAKQIVVAGVGLGAIDACLAAAVEEKIAGVASIGTTTMRDWAQQVAPGEHRFFHLMPYAPGLLSMADLDRYYAAVAPRPLVVVRRKDGWPRSGFDQVVDTASRIYALEQSADALLALGPRDVTEQLQAGASSELQKLLIMAARTLVPTPPQPGIVGTVTGLKSRASADSAAGLIWLVAEMDGYDQEFVDGNYQLPTWSFFNDNGADQRDRVVTPLVFRQDGDKYQLTAIGTTRTNTGTGVQSFAFEATQGSGQIGDGYFFGWHTGDPAGTANPGVIEYEDASDARMLILTADGQLSGQKLKIGETYRLQSQFPRRYSVMAVSKQP